MRWKSKDEFAATAGHFVTDRFASIHGKTPRFRSAYLHSQINEVEAKVADLRQWLSDGDPTNWQEPAHAVMEAAELAMLVWRDLALASEGREFLAARRKVLQLAWPLQTPSAKDAGRRAHSKLADAALGLRYAYVGQVKQSEQAIVGLVDELPEDLKSYFVESRDCISVELEELGAMSALRGLEAVLRETVRRKGVQLLRKPGDPPKPLHDEDLHDIIEGAGQLRWANSGAPVIDKPIKQLLETLRAFRNATAHPRQRPLEAGSELAVLAAKQAAALWADASIPKRRLKSKEVQKSW